MKQKIKRKIIKGLAIITKDKKLCELQNMVVGTKGAKSFAIWPENTKFDKKILKEYKVKVVSCNIVLHFKENK